MTLASRHLSATFDAATGNLLALRAHHRSPNFIRSFYERHHSNGTDGEIPFHLDKLIVRDESVEAMLVSDHLRVRRRFELKPNDALLRVRYSIRPVRGAGSLRRVAFPHIEFAEDFAETYTDHRDLYCDGAELGDGRELPCWRVFFQQDRDAGLMLATRCKRQMGHFLILARGLNGLPHVRVNYSTNYELPAAPMPARNYDLTFEIGPWSRERHAAIVRAAKLNEPVDVGIPSPRGRPGPQRPGTYFYAHRFARPAQASATFRKNRWLIARLPWARQGKALLAGTGVLPPPVTLRPKLRGAYRVFVGVGDSSGIKLRFSGDPEPTFRLNRITSATSRRRSTFDLHLSGRHSAGEVDCGTVRMDGRSVRLERFPDPHQAATIDYVRFVPVKSVAPKQRTAPRIMLCGMADAPDLAPLTNPLDPSIASCTANIWEHARSGFEKVYWRIDGQCSDFPSSHNTMRYVSAKVHGMYYPQAKAYGRLLRKYNLLKEVIAAGRKYGVEIWGWMRFNNYSGNVQSDFFRQHPEYHETWENGAKAGKLCLAFPEVRRHKIDILVEAASYGLPGLNLGFLRHAPVIHRHPILVEGFKKRYGQDPPLVLDKADQTHRFSLPPMDDESMRWYRYRAEFLTQFGRELRQALRDANLAHVKISLWLRPNHHLYDGIDLDDWLAEGLCDEVVASARVFPDERLPIAEPTPSWRATVQKKVPLIRGGWAHDMEFLRNNAERWIAEGYAGISTYESNAAVLDSRLIDFYNGLR